MADDAGHSTLHARGPARFRAGIRFPRSALPSLGRDANNREPGRLVPHDPHACFPNGETNQIAARAIDRYLGDISYETTS
jgi:hypothetical protein